MTAKAKIQFSAEELDLMRNSEWILTKNRIVEKIANGFGMLAENILSDIQVAYPAIAREVSVSGYKISRGEKYQGLPYLILDLPRIFGKENILAIRVLFWWGNYFSITLHTKGKYSQELMKTISGGALDDDNLSISFSGDEWNHDLRHADYQPYSDIDNALLNARYDHNGFLKLARSVNLADWEDAERVLYVQFQKFLKLINTSFQAGEKGL